MLTPPRTEECPCLVLMGVGRVTFVGGVVDPSALEPVAGAHTEGSVLAAAGVLGKRFEVPVGLGWSDEVRLPGGLHHRLED